MPSLPALARRWSLPCAIQSTQAIRSRIGNSRACAPRALVLDGLFRPKGPLANNFLQTMSTAPALKGTADLCDEYLDSANYLDYLGLRDFGAVKQFQGSAVTVQCIEDNTKVKECLAEEGTGKVLIVHAGGCLTRAFVGDMIASTAIKNNWSGVIVNGCVRDSAELAKMSIGIKALGSHPRKTERRGDGTRDIPVTFGGCTFHPGAWVVADEDGVVVLDKAPCVK